MSSNRKAASSTGRRGYGNDAGNSDVAALRYGNVDAELLRECVDSVSNAGDAILFARTIDGGAFVLRVLSDSGNGVWYPPSDEALVGVLQKVIEIARGL